MRALFSLSRLAPALLFVLGLGGCPRGAQIVAQQEDGGSSTPDVISDGDPEGDAPCPWTVEMLSHELPIAAPSTGKTVDYRVALEPALGEFGFVYKSELNVLSTQVLFHRVSETGLSLFGPLELQAELPPLQAGASWHHSLLGVVYLDEAWVALWSQMGYLKDSVGYDYLESGIYAQRVRGGALVGSRQTLVTAKTYFRALDLHWTGTQLLVATVEGPPGSLPFGFGYRPQVKVRRFDASFVPLGDAIAIPEQDDDAPLINVQELRIAGDDQRLGVFFVGWRHGISDTDSIFALIEDQQLVAVQSELLARQQNWPHIALAYGGGRFLSCTTIPPTCRLRDTAHGQPLGPPITFYAPAAEPPRAALWHHDRFRVALSASGDSPLQRVLGWVDSAGHQGQQLLWGDSTLSFASSVINYTLHSADDNTLFWIDNLQYFTGDGSVLMRLAQECP